MIELLVVMAMVASNDGRGRLELSGEAGCPTAAQIIQSLARLDSHLAADLDRRGWRLALSADARAPDFEIRVQDPSNAVIGERRFIGLSDCGQRAEAVAATLAVWLGALAAEPLPAPVYPPAALDHPPPSAPRARTPRALAASFAAAPAVLTRRWQLELGAAALGSIDETGAGAAGVDLSAWGRPLAWRWGLQAHLEWEAPRSLPVGPGLRRLAAREPRGWSALSTPVGMGWFRAGGRSAGGRHPDPGPRLDGSSIWMCGFDPGVFIGGRFLHRSGTRLARLALGRAGPFGPSGSKWDCSRERRRRQRLLVDPSTARGLGSPGRELAGLTPKRSIGGPSCKVYPVEDRSGG